MVSARGGEPATPNGATPGSSPALGPEWKKCVAIGSTGFCQPCRTCISARMVRVSRRRCPLIDVMGA
eukprot:12907250-Prorocentrum_lima.AAC.1